jgi:plastocyanin
MTPMERDLSQATISRRRVLRFAALVPAAVAAGGLLAACGGGSSNSGSSGGGTTVNMTDALKFEPASVTIKKGDKVTWKNTGSLVHTATCDPSKASNPADVSLPSGAQPFDSGDVAGGKTFSQTFNVAGTYKYFCKPHESGGMVGTITVQ